MDITYQPIGFIHSRFVTLEEMPIQPSGDASDSGFIELLPDYVDGLQDLDGFSHLFLIYHFHQVSKTELVVTPFLDSQSHGVFATRAPTRPNPIGLSIVRLMRIEGNILHLADVDVLDGTPLLDLKPYIPQFDTPENPRIGWLHDVEDNMRSMRSDDRFT
jgi:tRNA-Thr(GGU) m(6)t(6)A37 methyltransferase TsaA